MQLRLLALLLPLAIACSSSDNPTAPKIESTTFASSLGVDLAASTRTASGLYYRDLTPGTGTTATSGHAVNVYYSGKFPDGTQFDAKAAPATPFNFTLGIGQVIAGWDQGVAGMKAGGVRQLIVPPSLGYGSSAYLSIPGNSILVFVVTLVSVQ